MCARRFLFLVFILTLLAVAGAFAIFQFGDRVLLESTIPNGHFAAPPAGDVPDYTKLDAWISRPGIENDPSVWEPTGPSPEPGLRPRVATFYIHPTTYLERDRWNAPLHPSQVTEARTRLFVQTQASALDIDEVWAPRYRQAAFGAFLQSNEDAQKAIDLAYQDVSEAFHEFLRQVDDTKPIILAGHSQGALLLMRLLKAEVAGKPVQKRIIAAYVVGWPISTKADLPALGLPACRTQREVGCILSWMSFRDPANPNLILKGWEKTKGLSGGSRQQNDILCVNPITGIQNGADLKGIGGIVVPSMDPNAPTLNFNSLGAHCDKGILIVDGELPPLGPYVLPGNNYHVYDYALFYGAIGQDAFTRVNAWYNR